MEIVVGMTASAASVAWERTPVALHNIQHQQLHQIGPCPSRIIRSIVPVAGPEVIASGTRSTARRGLFAPHRDVLALQRQQREFAQGSWFALAARPLDTQRPVSLGGRHAVDGSHY